MQHPKILLDKAYKNARTMAKCREIKPATSKAKAALKAKAKLKAEVEPKAKEDPGQGRRWWGGYGCCC